MKIVSVILARGGSKGIPRKNLLKVKNRPLIYYTINASLNSQTINKTYVSTDDVEIAKISESYGAEVIKRAGEYVTDCAQSDPSLVHFANQVDFDILVFIQATSPLTTSRDIDCGVNMLSRYDSVFSAYKEHWVPRWSKQLRPIDWDINNRPRRQDVDYAFVENGAFYITKRECLLKSNLRYSGKIGIYEMPLSRSFQIDEENDVSIVESLIS